MHQQYTMHEKTNNHPKHLELYDGIWYRAQMRDDLPNNKPQKPTKRSTLIVLVGIYVTGQCLFFCATTDLSLSSSGRPGNATSRPTTGVVGAQGAGGNVAKTPAGVKPTPVVLIPIPIPPSSILNGHDVSRAPPEMLRQRADTEAGKANYLDAVVLQYWAVQGDPTEGLYNLACYLSRTGQINAALYWLQKAAIEEGVDEIWAKEDEDLENVRQDLRWPQIERFLTTASSYWENKAVTETVIVLPKVIDSTKSIPLVVGLHGMGSNPTGFVPKEEYQQLADKLQVGFVGVSGTISKGAKIFVWSEDIERDHKRVMAAISEVSNQVKVAYGRTILFGFSQGAFMAAQIASRNPERYAGAMVFSPGTIHEFDVKNMPPGDLAKQVYLLSVGSDEQSKFISISQQLADYFKKSGAETTVNVRDDQRGHQLPPDYYDLLEKQITHILAKR